MEDADDATAANLFAIYERELSNTYVAYSGTPRLASQGDYARIDGSSVWIEFRCQSSVHYHSVWRDHTRDYGGSFSF